MRRDWADRKDGEAIAEVGRFSPQDVAAILQGLNREEKVARLRQYLEELRAQRQQIGKRLDFFQGEGLNGETVFYGPATPLGAPPMGHVKNVLVIDAHGRVYNMTLRGLIAVDSNRPVPKAEIDLQTGQADLLLE